MATAFGELLDCLQFLQHAPRAGNDFMTDRREQDTPAAALDELHLERRLQLLQLRAQRRLADMAALCGPSKVEGIGNGNE
jgi:hypothetical protein